MNVETVSRFEDPFANNALVGEVVETACDSMNLTEDWRGLAKDLQRQPAEKNELMQCMAHTMASAQNILEAPNKALEELQSRAEPLGNW